MPTLEELRDRYVFESSPTRHDLGALHVPFDDLVGNHRTEHRLDGAVRRQERAALIGPSGSGKSSVLARVLGSDIEGVAQLIVPLAALPATTIDTPSHLVDDLQPVLVFDDTDRWLTLHVQLGSQRLLHGVDDRNSAARCWFSAFKRRFSARTSLGSAMRPPVAPDTDPAFSGKSDGTHRAWVCAVRPPVR